MILTADLHLDDKIENEYRWRVFDRLKEHSDGDLYILGDLCDRVDRHSAVLVNRLVEALTNLTGEGNKITILCGNHDRPLRRPPYWLFLNQLKNILFVAEPCAVGDLLLLPYSADPLVDWKDIRFGDYNCALIHQTMKGVHVGHGRILEDVGLDAFPNVDILVYSGDIHHCQTIGNVTYIGAPHPVRFGDHHRCRFLRLDEAYRIDREITLRRIRKAVVEINSVTQLKQVIAGPGDQFRIRYTLASGRMEAWPIEQQIIADWAKQKGCHLASVEAVVETGPGRRVQALDFSSDPEQVLAAYCRAEGIESGLYQAGLEILRQDLL